MRLMHVYLGHSYGGIERLLLTTLRLRHLWPTIETSFVLYPPGDFRVELEIAGAAAQDLGAGRVRLRNPLSLWRARRRLHEIIVAERTDLVAVHNLWLWTIFGSAVRSAGRPAVLWLHDPPDRATHWAARWARLTVPDQVLCHSHYTARRAPAMFSGVPVETVHCPVEPVLADKNASRALRAATRAELGIAENMVIILQVCRPSAHKGNLQLVQALAKLRHLPNWICLQVGRPVLPVQTNYYEGVKRAASELGIADRVRFLGYRNDLEVLLAAADIHCQPNLEPEPFGIAFVEALYAGLPVVTTAMGGALEIIDESCGILVPPGDLEALAGTLAKLIGNRELRVRLGINGPTRARQLCDPATQMAKLEAVLLKAGLRATNGTSAQRAKA